MIIKLEVSSTLIMLVVLFELSFKMILLYFLYVMDWGGTRKSLIHSSIHFQGVHVMTNPTEENDRESIGIVTSGD